MLGFLPKWFLESHRIAFRLLLTNTYHDFDAIRTFLTAALEHFTCDDEERKTTPIKYIKVKVADKGVKNMLQYITVDIYLVMRDKAILQLSQSYKVQLRGPMDRG